MDPRSWPDSDQVTEQQRKNRYILRDAMLACGFAPYECEWWHFAYGERLWAMKNKTTPIYGFHPICKE